MDKKIYKYYPDKIIETGKKVERRLPDDTTNLALIALRRQNLNYSRAYENFLGKILELNEKVKPQNMKQVVGVVKYWMSALNQ